MLNIQSIQTILKAWLGSMIFEATESRCMRFWYSMNGDGIGKLRVVIEYENKAKKTIWQLSKDQGDDWLYGQVSLNSLGMSYRIYIIGIRGPNERGNIAIDDISFVDGSSCVVSPLDVIVELALITTTTASPPPLTNEITCNFDSNNMCGWARVKRPNWSGR